VSNTFLWKLANFKLGSRNCLTVLRERFAHAKRVEAFGKASSDLLKKIELLEAEQKARIEAEGRSVKLNKTISVQKQKIEDLELQLESEKHVTDAANQELLKLRSASGCDDEMFRTALRISSDLSTVMIRLGARPTLRKFTRGDTQGALSWCINTLEMLPRAIRTFAGFSCATGARVVGASIEYECEHITKATKKDFKLCGAEGVGNMSDVVRKLGRRVYYLLWEKGDLEEFVRNEASQKSKKVGFQIILHILMLRVASNFCFALLV